VEDRSEGEEGEPLQLVEEEEGGDPVQLVDQMTSLENSQPCPTDSKLVEPRGYLRGPFSGGTCAKRLGRSRGEVSPCRLRGGISLPFSMSFSSIAENDY
jgi:hypothetical protein